MRYRNPVNSYRVHDKLGTAVLTVHRQEGVLSYAIFDADVVDLVASNGPYHIRSAVIYSVKGFTLQNLLAKVYGLGAIHTHIDCDFRRQTFEKRVVANSLTLEQLHERKNLIRNSTETHPRTGVLSEDLVTEVTSLAPGNVKISFKINTKYLHFVPKYIKFNLYWGVCTRKGVTLTSILRKAGLVECTGKYRLRNLYDYTIRAGRFVHSGATRFAWKYIDDLEGYLLEVYRADVVLHRIFTDGVSYDSVCANTYSDKLTGLAQDIMTVAGHEVRSVHVPARFKKYYAKALDAGEKGYKARAKYENAADMTLMTKAKRVKFKKVIAEKIIYVEGKEAIDMRPESMRLHDDK